MKKMKLFISLILVIIIFIVTTGCSSSSAQGEGWKDQNKPGNQEWSDPNSPDDQEWSDPNKPDDQEWKDPEKPGDQEWSDPEKPDDQEWRDPENPGTEPVDPGASDQTGTYKHEIGGIVFYTEHDVEQWIDRSNPNLPNFDLNQMVKDIFGDEAISGNNIAKIPYYGRTKTLDIKNRDTTGNYSDWYAGNGYYPCIQIDNTVICDMGDGSSDYFKPRYRINGSDYTTEYEMIEIALYACERWAGDGEVQYMYLFDNFRSSDRFFLPEPQYR